MGDYAREVQKLHQQLMEVVLESLGLDPNYLHEEIAQGSQVSGACIIKQRFFFPFYPI